MVPAAHKQQVKPRVYVSRRFHFSAAHRIYNPAWSDAENARVFGPCSHPAGHGHNYELEVVIAGSPHPDTGYVMDIALLKKLVEENVLSQLDHRNLNTDVPFLADQIPTSENLIVSLWREIQRLLPSEVQLVELRLWETPRNCFIYHGETY
ncbi:MAG: 6-carboxytetrahydropterin synthase [Bacteroidia bacterium]|nr:6-carboxytetrahydropterin synthase [Bacteroidia bacterium]MDW8235911.1 6-carboxytetrahydropterin synthase [Bacteroidia bacterium]